MGIEPCFIFIFGMRLHMFAHLRQCGSQFVGMLKRSAFKLSHPHIESDRGVGRIEGIGIRDEMIEGIIVFQKMLTLCLHQHIGSLHAIGLCNALFFGSRTANGKRQSHGYQHESHTPPFDVIFAKHEQNEFIL